MPHPAQLLSDPRRPYVPQNARADSAPTRNPTPETRDPLSLPPPFDPPEAITRKLLRQLVDPTLSLTTIADTHNTDLDSLCAWMAREDIRERFHNFRSACAERTRAAAENCLSMVVQTAHAVIHEFHDDQHHMNFKPQDPQGHEIKRRNRETAMRAGRLLLRLAKYYSLDLTRPPRDAQPAHTPPSGTPTLRGGSSASGTPTPRVGSSSTNSDTSPPGTPTPGTPTLRGGSPSSPASHIRHPKSDTPNPTSELLLALLDNPALADELTQALAAKQAKAPATNAGAAAPATPPVPNPSLSEISNLKSEIPPSPPAPAPAPTPQSEIPNPQSEIAPAIPPPKSNLPPDPRHPRSSAAASVPTPVNLTISAHPLPTAAGAPHARAP